MKSAPLMMIVMVSPALVGAASWSWRMVRRSRKEWMPELPRERHKEGLLAAQTRCRQAQRQESNADVSPAIKGSK